MSKNNKTKEAGSKRGLSKGAYQALQTKRRLMEATASAA
jgi:hypothetical protein